MSFFHSLLAGQPLDADAQVLADAFNARVVADAGTYEGDTCLVSRIARLKDIDLWNNLSLVLTANGSKLNKLYCAIPTDGSGDLAFTRADATVRKGSGTTLEAVATGVPRIDYIGESCPGISLFPSRTNLLVRSQEFDNASWTKTNLTPTADAVTAPDGTLTADALVENTSVTVAHTVGGAFTSVTGNLHAMSVYAKEIPGAKRYLSLQVSGAGFVAGQAIFDIATGRMVWNNSLILLPPIIKYIGDGWYKVVIVVTCTSSAAAAFTLGVATSQTSLNSYTGNGLAGFYLWQAQTELHSASSSIVTTSATVTRATDAITAKTGITTLIGQTEGTFFAEVSTFANAVIKTFAISNGTDQERIIIQFSSSNFINATIVDNNVVQATIIAPLAFASNRRYRIAVVYRSNYAALFVNGVKVGQDLTVTVPTCTQLEQGSGTGVQPFHGNVYSLELRKVAISDADAIALTDQIPGTVDNTINYYVYNSLAVATRYYFGQGLEQNPINPNTVMQFYHDGERHTFATGKKSVSRKSTDRGKTFGSPIDVWSDATFSNQGGSYGFDGNGRLHGLLDAHDEFVLGSTHKLFYVYSDDDGATWTTADRSDLIPSDGNLDFRVHGSLFRAGDYLIGTLYTVFDETSFAASSRYIIRKNITAATDWEVVLVATNPANVLICESGCVYLDEGYIVLLSRNETTKEWTQDMSNNFGAPGSFTAQGDVNFGLSLITAGPVILKTFLEGSTKIVVAYLADRSGSSPTSSRLKAVYTTAPELRASGAAGWHNETLVGLVPINQQNIVQTYGTVLHHYNNFNAIASLPLEALVFDPEQNQLILFDIQSTHYNALKRMLGL